MARQLLGTAPSNTNDAIPKSYADTIRSGAWGIVNHGSTAGTARPTSGYTNYIWVGTVQPTNWASGDIWIEA